MTHQRSAAGARGTGVASKPVAASGPPGDEPPRFSDSAVEADAPARDSDLPTHPGYVHAQPARVFIGYAKEDQAFCAHLLKHLEVLRKQTLIDVWHEGVVTPGQDLKQETRVELDRADLIIFLVSAYLVASKDCWERDVRRALARRESAGIDVVPIHVRSVDLAGTALAEIESLPSGGPPIEEWAHPDRAFSDVAKALHSMLTERPHRSCRHEPPPKRSRELVSRVAQIAKLRAPDAEVQAFSAPAPFDGLVLTAQSSGRDIEVEPIGVIDGPISQKVLDVFIRDVEGPYRREDPLLRARVVHTGPPASDELHRFAKQRGVVLESFAQYQKLIDFTRYLRRQTERLDQDPAYPPRLYVEQRAEVRIRLDRENTDDALERLVALLKDPYPRFILVLGDFGTGKTFLLRQLARRLAREHLDNPEDVPPPILVEMRALEKSLGLDKLLAQHFQLPDVGRIPVDAFRYMLSEGRAALLFDGFDELAFRVTYDRVIEHFDTVMDSVQGRAKVIVTSRTAHFLSDKGVELVLARRATNVDGYRLIKLHPFDDRQIQRALAKRLGERQAERQLQLLRQVEDLMGLSANPRMLGFILDLPTKDLEEARSRAGKITAASLYELLVARWLQGEVKRAEEGRAEHALSYKQLWQAVTELALLLWPRTEKGLYLRDIPESLFRALQILEPGQRSDAEEAKLAAGSRSLLVRDEEGRFSFLHESILDWLVARVAAIEVVEQGNAPALGKKAMSDLMTDFFGAMAGRRNAIAWAQAALSSGNDVAVANASRVLRRLGAESEKDVSIDVEIDLSNLDLRGQDFSGTDYLRGAVLSGTDLSGATLASADLSDAQLRRAKLVGVNAERACLRGACLDEANLDQARLLGADLRGASFGQVRARYAQLVGAQVDRVTRVGVDTFGATPPSPARAEPAVLGGLMHDVGAFGAVGLAVSPDGALLAAGYGGTIAVWDLARGRLLRSFGRHEGQITALAFTPDGRSLATASEDRTVRLWDPRSGNCLRRLAGHQSVVQGLAFTPKARFLVSVSADRTVRIWDPRAGELVRTLEGHRGGVHAVAISPDGGMIASASQDRTVRLWDAQTDQLVHVFEGHDNWVFGVAFSPDGQLLATASRDGSVRLWDLHTGEVRRALEGHQGGVLGAAFSPDGRMLASASQDKTVRLWEVASGRLARVLKGHQSWLFGAAFSPAGDFLAAACEDKVIRLWDPATGALLHALWPGPDEISAVAVAAGGLPVASAGSDKTVRLWDPRRGNVVRILSGHQDAVSGVAFSPDGRSLVSCSADRTLRLWDTRTGKVARLFEGHQSAVSSVAFSPDGLSMVSGSDDRTVRVWDVQKGKPSRLFKGHQEGVLAVAFAPDGAAVASAGQDATVRVWDTQRSKLVRLLEGHLGSVLSVAFAPQGRSIASASADKTVRLWDARTGKLLRTLEGHKDGIAGVAFSPDGRCVATASLDGSIRLWDAVSGDWQRTLEGHRSAVSCVSFTPDGLSLVSSSADNTVRVWRASDGACLACLVPAEQGFAAFAPDGRYKVKGDVGGRFWHVVELCRFEPGELDPYVDAFTQLRPLRLGEEDPLW